MPINPMTFEIQQSPIFGKGLAEAIEGRLKQYEAATKAAELPYAGPSKLAETLSRTAYAAQVQPQYLSKLAANPAFFNNLTKEQQVALINAVGNQPGVGSPAVANAALNIKPGEVSDFGVLGDLGSKLLGAMGMNSAPPASQQSSPLSSGISNAMNPGMQQQQLQQPVSNDVREVSGMPGSSATRDMNVASIGEPPPDTTGMTPIQRGAVNKAYQERMGAAGHETGKIQAKAIQDLRTQSQQEAQEAQDMSRNLENFHNVYQKSTLVGPQVGKLAAYGPEAGQLKSLSATLQANQAAKLFGSKTSNYKEQMAKDMKLNPEMNRATEQGAYDRLQAASERMKEKGDFVESAFQRGITDPQKIEQMWFNYNEKVPFFNLKTLKPISENIGDSNAHTDFINQELEKKPSLARQVAKQIAKENPTPPAPGNTPNQAYYEMKNGKIVRIK